VRGLLVIVGLVAYGAAAAATDPLAPFKGRVVISSEVPPTDGTKLPAYLEANADKDNSYIVTKGAPWSLHMVAVLVKDTKQIKLELADKADKKLAPLVSIDLVPKHKLVIAHAQATIAAGFAADKTYVVRLFAGKTVVARADVTLRD
jgi:hypothetical protein